MSRRVFPDLTTSSTRLSLLAGEFSRRFLSLGMWSIASQTTLFPKTNQIWWQQARGNERSEERSAIFSGTGYAQAGRNTEITARRRSKTSPNMMWQAYVWIVCASLAEGYCDCSVCSQEQAASGKDPIEWRAQQIESFVKEIRDSLPCKLGLTIEPDPCYGKERFGLDLEKLAEHVDFISTPLYMDYSIVYWLDIIAYCFRKRISKPYFIELYAGHPRAPAKHLVSALAVASAYADCVVLSTYEAGLAESLQREMVGSREIWRFFEDHSCVDMLDVLSRWQEEIGGTPRA